jgi:hypothetical protein
MARVVTPNHAYTTEFRQTTGWDTGIGRDGVLIHELRSNSRAKLLAVVR